LIDFIEQSNLSTLFEGFYFYSFWTGVLRNKLPKLLANQTKLLFLIERKSILKSANLHSTIVASLHS